MSDITEIEAEARAYVEDCWDRGEPEVGEYRYLVAMLAVIDGLREEIRRVKTLSLDHAIELSEAAIELARLRAEIARLRPNRGEWPRHRGDPT